MPTIGKSRRVYFDDPEHAVECAVFHATVPNDGWTVSGPCIIEYPGQSVVVPPGARVAADRLGNLHVRLAG